MHNAARKSAAGALAIVVALSGCAVSPTSFRNNPSAHSDATVCRALRGNQARADPTFAYDLTQELGRRGIPFNSCDSLIAKQDATIGIGVLLGAALIAVAASKGGGGGGYNTAQYDTEWDWDQFYNQYRQLVWACHGVQTGQFAEAYHCAGKYQTDYRWPSKEAP
jgi:hypothetical protein